MTNKEIIIDGVNVLNCGHYARFEGETENACYIIPIRAIGSDVNIGFGSCNFNPNCYYKQLKRKEQECDQLRGGQRDQNKVIKELKADLEKEKALKQTYIACYKTKHRDVKGKLFKYENLKQALQEIKEIVIKTGIDHKWDMRFQRWKAEILQKCEVLDE